MLPVAKSLPLRFDAKGNARTRIPARPRPARRLLEAIAIAAGFYAVAYAISWLVCTL